jgi:Flp pilus assembly protein protease CpaA
MLAIVGNAAGSLALVGVALTGLRRRPVGNTLLLAGFAVAALGSALAGLGAAETAAFVAVGALLLYGGTVARR